MSFFNIDSLNIDSEKFPYKKNKIGKCLKDYEKNNSFSIPLLIDNDFEIIGNPETYYVSKELGKKAVYGQRITKYKKNISYPDRFSVEISGKCNFNCSMCPRTALIREQSFMEEDLFYKIVNDIEEHKNEVSMVDLHRLGEGTYHPKFEKFIDYLDGFDKPLISCMASNVSVVDERLLERIMNSSLRIFIISINALDAQRYKYITGGKGNWKHLQKIVKIAKKLKKRRTPFLAMQFIENEGTEGCLDRFINEYIDYADYIESSLLEDFGGQLKQNIEYIEKHNIKMDKRIERIPCQRATWGEFHIYSNGNVVPCICDINAEYLKMGNVKDNTIAEIFHSKAWNEFRKMHRENKAGEHPLCGPCHDWMIYSDYNKKNKFYK